IVVLILGITGCAAPGPGAAARPDGPIASASATPSSANTPTSPTSAASAGSAATARVIGVAVSSKADNYTVVTISFENKTTATCKSSSYVLSWPGGTKEFPLENFELAPGQSKTRGSRLHKGEGDITTLTGAEDARVEVRSTCR